MQRPAANLLKRWDGDLSIMSADPGGPRLGPLLRRAAPRGWRRAFLIKKTLSVLYALMRESLVISKDTHVGCSMRLTYPHSLVAALIKLPNWMKAHGKERSSLQEGVSRISLH